MEKRANLESKSIEAVRMWTMSDKQDYFMRQAIAEAKKAWDKGKCRLGRLSSKMMKLLDAAITSANLAMMRQHARDGSHPWCKCQAKELATRRVRFICNLGTCMMCSGAIVLSRLRRLFYLWPEKWDGWKAVNLTARASVKPHQTKWFQACSKMNAGFTQELF